MIVNISSKVISFSSIPEDGTYYTCVSVVVFHGHGRDTQAGRVPIHTRFRSC